MNKMMTGNSIRLESAVYRPAPYPACFSRSADQSPSMAI
jgi:hypothetical protein